VAIRDSEIIALLSAYAGSGRDAPVEPVNFSNLVAETLRLLRNSISRKAVVQMNLAPDLPVVWANSSQLRQIVMNLAMNASEALGDEAGTITVTTARAGESDRGLAQDEPYVRLEVSDTGPGMTEEVRNKVFDPFFSTKSIGRGLGLAAVQGIARGIGGEVRVRSAPGQGATFEVVLPCSHKRATAAAKSPA